jgi:hypothetical protein
MSRAIVGLDDNVNEEMTYKCNTAAEEDGKREQER